MDGMYTADYTVRVSMVLLTTQASRSQDGGLNRTIIHTIALATMEPKYEVQQLQVMAKRMTGWSFLRLLSADSLPLAGITTCTLYLYLYIVQDARTKMSYEIPPVRTISILML